MCIFTNLFNYTYNIINVLITIDISVINIFYYIIIIITMISKSIISIKISKERMYIFYIIVFIYKLSIHPLFNTTSIIYLIIFIILIISVVNKSEFRNILIITILNIKRKRSSVQKKVILKSIIVLKLFCIFFYNTSSNKIKC